MVDGTEQALAFADSTARPFTPTHVSHKQVEAHPLQRLLLQEETGALVALVKVGEGLRQIAVPRNITARGEPPAGSMLVRYAPDEAHPDGYLAFSPREAFDEGYSAIRPAEHRKSYEGGGRGLTFGQAIEQLKAGDRVARDGWNGKGMWLSLSAGTPDLPAANFWSPHNRAFAEMNGGSASVLPTISMKTAAGEILMGWTPNGIDLLAEDWCVV